MQAKPHLQGSQPGRLPLDVPGREGRQHAAGARQGVGRVAAAGVGDAERRQQRVADELLQAAAVAEHFLLHAAVEVAQ